MKIIKAILSKNRSRHKTDFTYPDGWDPTKINVIAYEDSDKMGDVEEYCIGIVHDDKYAEELLKNPAVIEITESEANILGDQCKPQRNIVDERQLPEILLALAKVPSKRTAKEKEMLNPNSDAPGIRKTQKFDVRNWIPDLRKGALSRHQKSAT